MSPMAGHLPSSTKRSGGLPAIAAEGPRRGHPILQVAPDCNEKTLEAEYRFLANYIIPIVGKRSVSGIQPDCRSLPVRAALGEEPALSAAERGDVPKRRTRRRRNTRRGTALSGDERSGRIILVSEQFWTSGPGPRPSSNACHLSHDHDRCQIERSWVLRRGGAKPAAADNASRGTGYVRRPGHHPNS